MIMTDTVEGLREYALSEIRKAAKNNEANKAAGFESQANFEQGKKIAYLDMHRRLVELGAEMEAANK